MGATVTKAYFDSKVKRLKDSVELLHGRIKVLESDNAVLTSKLLEAGVALGKAEARISRQAAVIMSDRADKVARKKQVPEKPTQAYAVTRRMPDGEDEGWVPEKGSPLNP